MHYTMLVVALLALLFTSCKKEGMLAPTTVLNEMIDTTKTMDSTTAQLKFSGDFISGPFGTVTGKAEIYKTGIKYNVRLANFTSTNGPALHVYVSQESMPINFIDLGVLKSISGNQVYSVSGMPDFNNYKYISIHCIAYNHLFGSALLK